MDFANIIQTIAIYALPVLFAITVHEAAHGYAARYFGDNTAWSMGRVTLNPIKHIDPVGTIAMPLFLYVATAGTFLLGYAKPVPVQFGNLRKPKQHMVWGAVFYVATAAGVTERFVLEMCRAGMLVNVVMFVFNLFPLPPLDGGRILVGLLPWRQANMVSRVEPWGFFIVMGLILTGVISSFWMRPLMTFTYNTLQTLLSPLVFLLR